MDTSKQKGGSIHAIVVMFFILSLCNIFCYSHAFASVSVPCRAYIGYPLPNQELPIDYRTARDDCPTGTPEGLQTVTGTVYGAPAGTTITVTSTFIHGRPSGTTTLTSSFGLSFVGNIQNDGTVVGKTTYPDGHSDEGTSSHGKLVTGIITRPAAMGGGVNYFIQSASVTREQYVSFVSHNIQSPAQTPASTQVVADSSSPALPKTDTRTSQSGRDSSQCFADRPTAWYTVTGTYEGECVGGNFTGRAEMRLVPKDPQDATMTIIAPYRDGQIAGDVEIQYTQINAVYRGSLQQWSPYNGRMSQNLGNRTFEISEFRNGETVATRREYKQPSEFETAFIGILSAELNKGINRTLDSAFNGAQKRHDRRVAQAAQNQQMVAAQSSQNANTSVFTNQNRQSASVAVLGNSGANTQTGTYQAGAPLGQSIAKNDASTPVFGGNTNPPDATTAPPQFGGSTSPQEPIVGTQPPVDVGVPPPFKVDIQQPILTTQPPTNPELPAPFRVDTNQPAETSLPSPTRNSEPIPPPLKSGTSDLPPTLPPPSNNDTLGSGRVENPIVPAPLSSGILNTGQQNGYFSNQLPTQPDISQSTSRIVSAPTVPFAIAPTNQNPLALPIPLQWSRVNGSTYYELAVRDLTTNQFVVDQRVSGTTFQSSIYSYSRSFRWTVRACNSAGCSGWSSGATFQTGNNPTYANANSNTYSSTNFTQDAFASASQGTKDCAIALARQTGESVEAAYQIITSAGGWQQLANATATSVNNIIYHPILSAQAAWQGLSGQVNGVRDAVNAGNASLACQRAITLSGTVIGTAEGLSLARSSLSNLRSVVNRSDEIASSALAKTATKSRGIWDDAYSVTRGDIIHQRLGQNTPSNFPVFDIWNPATGRAVSIKSMDTLAASYQSATAFQRQVNGYVDSIANFKDITWSGLTIKTIQIRSRELLLAVPPDGLTVAQLSVLQSIRDRASSMGVHIIIQQIQ